MMTDRYSTCHYAKVMFSEITVKTMPPKHEEVSRCSWCGEPCDLVISSSMLGHDLELTLRRWKDGDCSLDDMFGRVNTELNRSWLRAFEPAAKTLQAGSEPKYIERPDYMDWQLNDGADHATP